MYINENLTRLYNTTSSSSTQAEHSAASSTTGSGTAAASEKSSGSIKVLSRVCMDVVSISHNYIKTPMSVSEDSAAVKLMKAASNIGRGTVSVYQEYLAGLEKEDTVDAGNYEQLSKENLASKRMNSFINRKG